MHHGKTTTQALQALLEQRRAGPGGVKKDEGKARQEGEEEEGANDSTSAAQGMAAGSESKPDEESPLELFSGLQMKEPFVRDLASCNRDQAATLANLSAANLQVGAEMASASRSGQACSDSFSVASMHAAVGVHGATEAAAGGRGGRSMTR